MKSRIKPEGITKAQIDREVEKYIEQYGERAIFDILIALMQPGYIRTLRDIQYGETLILSKMNSEIEKRIQGCFEDFERNKGIPTILTLREINRREDFIGDALGERKRKIPDKFAEAMQANVKQYTEGQIKNFYLQHPYYCKIEKFTNGFEFLADYPYIEMNDAIKGHKKREKLSFEEATQFTELRKRVRNKVNRNTLDAEKIAIQELLKDKSQTLSEEDRLILETRRYYIAQKNRNRTETENPGKEER